MADAVPATPLIMGYSGDQRTFFTPLVLTISAQDPATTVGAAVVATGATDQGPFGYTEAQANSIVTNINTLRTDMIAIFAQVNALRDDIQALTALVNAYVAA
jgi:hypothetical protein